MQDLMSTIGSALRFTTALALVACFSSVIAGCSAAADDPESAESSDDIQASTSKKQAEDLFKPDESTLAATIPATMPGLSTWKLYTNPKGTTIRGVSESGKIKVVYVVAYNQEGEGVRVKSVGFLRATDFALSDDRRGALGALTEAIERDFRDDSSSGISTQAETSSTCVTPKTRGYLIVGGLSTALAGALIIDSALCLAMSVPNCVGAIAILVTSGGLGFITGVGLDSCSAK